MGPGPALALRAETLHSIKGREYFSSDAALLVQSPLQMPHCSGSGVPLSSLTQGNATVEERRLTGSFLVAKGNVV